MQKETIYECFGISFSEITSLKEEENTYIMNPEKGEDILKRKDLSGKNVIIHDHPEIVGLLACDPKISIFYIKNEKKITKNKISIRINTANEANI